MKRRLIAVILLLLCFNLLIFSGCLAFGYTPSRVKEVEEGSVKDGCFKYYYLEHEDSYAIVGDGDEPFPQELAIPAYYNGKEISDVFYEINATMWGGPVVGPTLKGVKTVYFPYTGRFVEYGRLPKINYMQEVDVIFFIKNGNIGPLTESRNNRISYFKEDYYDNAITFKTDEVIKQKSNKTIYKNSENGSYTLQKANTAYMLNYNNAPNDGYFFINDFARGGLIKDTPYEPLREGYTFEGWYKDPECINKWDFAVDKLPEAEYDEDGDVTEFIETRLYAKWQVK